MKKGMSPAVSFLVYLIIALIFIVIAVSIYNFAKGAFGPADKKIEENKLCGEWIMKKCSILSSIYNEDLAKAGLCEGCPLYGTFPADRDLEEVEKNMISACRFEWENCKALCHCPQ